MGFPLWKQILHWLLSIGVVPCSSFCFPNTRISATHPGLYTPWLLGGILPIDPVQNTKKRNKKQVLLHGSKTSLRRSLPPLRAAHISAAGLQPPTASPLPSPSALLSTSLGFVFLKEIYIYIYISASAGWQNRCCRIMF